LKDVREFLALLTERGIGLISPDRDMLRYNIEEPGIINQIDVAHAMGFIQNPKAARLIAVKYANRSCEIHSLDIDVYLSVLDQFPEWARAAKTDRRPGTRGGTEFVRKMCQLAIAEHMDEHRCFICNGTSAKRKEDMKNVFHDMVFCETCKDTGRVYPTDIERASLMEVDQKIWERIWSNRFREIQGMLMAWEGSASVDMYVALRGMQGG